MFAPDIGAVEVANQPIAAAEEPDLDPARVQQRERASRRVRRQDMPGDGREIRADQGAAIEPGDGRGDLKGLDQSAQAARGTAADQRKQDSVVMQPRDGVSGVRRQDLIVVDQGAVDVGDQGGNFCRGMSRLCGHVCFPARVVVDRQP